MVKRGMDSESSHQGANPKRLSTLACNVKFSERNIFLHQFVLDNSDPNDSGSENYINAVMLSMHDVPGSIVNALNGDGYNALHLAVSKNNLLMVKKLLSCLVNVDINAIYWRDGVKTALHLAIELGHFAIVEFLVSSGADISDSGTLLAAVKSEQLDIAKFLLDRVVNFDIKSNRGCELLSYALTSGNLALVEFLVSNGADVNAPTLSGLYSTRLHEAVLYNSSIEVVEFLIDQGADLDARNVEGSTPLHFAVYMRRLDTVKLLVGKGADLMTEGRNGRTPFLEAVWYKNYKCAAFLLARMLIWKLQTYADRFHSMLQYMKVTGK